MTDVSVETQSPKGDVGTWRFGTAEKAKKFQLRGAAGREDVGMTCGVVLIYVGA